MAGFAAWNVARQKAQCHSPFESCEMSVEPQWGQWRGAIEVTALPVASAPALALEPVPVLEPAPASAVSRSWIA